MKRAVIIFADGFEEIETIAPIDILRRGDVDVLTVGFMGTTVTGAHGVIVHAQQSFDEYEYSEEDAIVIPGGGDNAQTLSESSRLADIIKQADSEGKLIASICASAALVLGKSAGILSGRKYTCYPGSEKFVENAVNVGKNAVVTDGNIITAKGPGSAIAFSLEVLRLLQGDQIADSLTSAMCVEV